MELHLRHTAHGNEHEQVIALVKGKLGVPPEGILGVDSRGKPLPVDGAHYSYAHKPGVFFLSLDSHAVGADLEIMKVRDESVLGWINPANWQVIGRRSWEGFYEGWTLLESIVKLRGATLDDSRGVVFLERADTPVRISGIPFQKRYVSVFDGKRVLSFVGRQEEIFYSVTQDHETL